LLAAVGSGLVPLVAACRFGTSNFDAQTNQFYTPAEGVNDRTSQVDVLNALVVSDQDGRGRFIAGLVNNSTTASDALQQVQGSGKNADVKGTLSSPISVGPNDFVQLADQGVEPVVLTGSSIVAGRFIELTLTFSQADEVTVLLPVVTSEDEYGELQAPTPSSTPSATPSSTPSGSSSASPSESPSATSSATS
jgi:hypothetical protein